MCVCGSVSAFRGDSLRAHRLVYLGNTSLFSEGDFPLCCQAFSKSADRSCFFWGGGGFLYLPGLLRFLDTSGHFAKRLWWSCFIAGEAWRPFVLCFVLFRGDFDACWCLFSPLSAPCYSVQIGNMAPGLFYEATPRCFHATFECYNSIKHHGIGP